MVLFSSIGLRDSREFLPLLLAGCLSISNPAAVSISLEGGRDLAASDTPGFYEAYNDGKAGLDGVFTFRGLAAGLACSGLAFLARRLASSGFGPCFTGLFSIYSSSGTCGQFSLS